MKLRDNEQTHHQGGSSDTLVRLPSRKGREKPSPLRCVITKPVLISIAGYATIIILDSAAVALIPLVWSTPIDFGGLDLSPATIGLWMSVYGCMNGISQLVFFPRAVRRFGLRRVFFLSVAACAVMYPMFPLENLAMRRAAGGSKMTVWVLVALQLLSLTVSRMGFSKPFLAELLGMRRRKLNFSFRRCVHIHIFSCTQQAVARRHEWPGADRGVDPGYDRTGRCRLALRVLHHEWCLGWKHRLCRAG